MSSSRRSCLAALASLTASPLALAQAEDVPAAPDFQPGDTWRYRQRDAWSNRDLDDYRTTVVRTDGDDALLGTEYTMEKGAVLPAPLPRGHRLVIRTGTIRSRAPFAQVAWMQFPLEPGKRWSSSYEMSSGGGKTASYSHSAQVDDWESVTVPAGRFRALKVSHTLRQMVETSDIILPAYNYYRFWYVPAVKRHVKYEREYRNTRNQRQDHFIEELVSFSVR